MDSTRPPEKGLAGEIARLTLEVETITGLDQAKTIARRLLHLAKHDILTELPNRTYLTDFVNRHGEKMRASFEAERPVTSITMCSLDLRDFKKCNNEYGHHTGDRLLQELARKMVLEVGSIGKVFRVGGDEFVVVFLGLIHEQAADEKVRFLARRLSGRYALKASGGTSISTDFNIRVRIGYDYSYLPLKEPMAMLQSAYTAMEIAKERGVSVLRFESQMHDRQERDQQLDQELRRVARSRELSLVYQPIIDIRSGATVGFEGLLRPPARLTEKFRDVTWADMVTRMERLGLVSEVSRRLLLPACQFFAQLNRFRANPVYVSLNISARQLEPNLIRYVRRALQESGLQPALLRLEITEHEKVLNAEQARTTLRRLKSLGVKILMDDYGSGNSTPKQLGQWLTYLDGLKLDGDYVRDLEVRDEYGPVIKSAYDMAHDDCNGDLIVEGVELVSQLEALRALGIRYVQGFLFSMPIAAEGVAGYLAESCRKAI